MKNKYNRWSMTESEYLDLFSLADTSVVERFRDNMDNPKRRLATKAINMIVQDHFYGADMYACASDLVWAIISGKIPYIKFCPEAAGDA
jgi:hypothetical protein